MKKKKVHVVKSHGGSGLMVVCSSKRKANMWKKKFQEDLGFMGSRDSVDITEKEVL